MENKQELKKNLGMSTAMATVVGCVIGSGVFFKPQAMYTATGGAPGLAMLAWLITGIVCIWKKPSAKKLAFWQVGCRASFFIPR